MNQETINKLLSPEVIFTLMYGMMVGIFITGLILALLLEQYYDYRKESREHKRN